MIPPTMPAATRLDVAGGLTLDDVGDLGAVADAVGDALGSADFPVLDALALAVGGTVVRGVDVAEVAADAVDETFSGVLTGEAAVSGLSVFACVSSGF